MKFKNLNEIQEYYQKQLSSGNTSVFKDIKTKNGKSYNQVADEILITEAKRLRACIQFWIDRYYDAYESNSVYQRTFGLKNALTAETQVNEDNGKKYIGLYFEDSKSWGKSFISNEYLSWKPWLINDGWKVHKQVNFKNTYHVGYYEGFNFIERGIADWKSESKFAKNINVKRIAGYEIINM